MAEGASGEDRTEDPTPHKLDEALKRGDVAKSQELAVFLSLGAFALVLMLLPGLGIGTRLAADLRVFLASAGTIADGAPFWSAARQGLLIAFAAAALPVGAAAVAALAAGLLQHRPVFSTDPLTPKGERLSPLAGLKRILGKEAIVNFVKGLAKIVIVGALASIVLWRERDRFEAMVGQEPVAFLSVTLSVAVKLLGSIVALHALVTIGDILYQRFAWTKRQRMTKEEVKRESKEQDGNPEIKAKLRAMRAARVRKRMMAAVPTATVVVTNPTHFAVALRYEAGMGAPVCVAKGIDAVALRIREVATEHRVAIVENPPLARALHATVDIDDEIPVEHYKAVAEVIGFVLRLGGRAR